MIPITSAAGTWALRALALWIQTRANGVTDELRAKWQALADEARDSLLEPQDNGLPWDEASILEWNERLNAAADAGIAIHAPHGDATGEP